jgi:hypothetical protein
MEHAGRHHARVQASKRTPHDLGTRVMVQLVGLPAEQLSNCDQRSAPRPDKPLLERPVQQISHRRRVPTATAGGAYPAAVECFGKSPGRGHYTKVL